MPELSSSTYEFSRQTSRRNNQKQPQLENVIINMRVTANSVQGHRKYMEDCYKIRFQRESSLQQQQNHNKTISDQQQLAQSDILFSYFGIFDGHGGKEASQNCKEKLYWKIIELDDFWSDDDSKVLNAIRNGFVKCHMDMWKELPNWPKTASGLPSTSGSTATVLFIKKNKAYVGHVGDSGLVIGYSKYPGGQWHGKKLTRDHKPEDPVELKRIQSIGGSVMSKSGVNRVVWNRPIFTSSSSSNFSRENSSSTNSTTSLSRKSISTTNSTPYELNYLRNQKNVPTERVPFLAVARSLGDLWSYDTQHDEFIVSPVPDTFCFEIDPRYHKCLILATDGLWNVLKSSESVELVRQTDRETERLISKRSNNNTSQVQPFINPSQRLVQTAIQKCCEKMIRADNTSCITIMIDQPPEYNTHLNSTHISRNKTFNDFSCNDFEDDDEFNSDFDDEEEEEDSDDINTTYRRRNRSMRSVINDDNKSEMFNTPLNNDKRSRSLISVRRRHWSASSNRSSSASSTIASSSTNNTKKFVNVEPRTRSSRNYNDMNKSASANSIYSMDQLNTNKKIFKTISNTTTTTNNNNNNVSIKKTNNLNTSTISKISKNLRKSLNDLYTSKQPKPKLPQSSTNTNIKEEQKENEDNKLVKKLESPTTNKNRYTKRLKRLKNRLIQTKNNLFNRKQVAKKTSPSSKDASNLNKLKSISSPHINKSDFKYKLNISSIDLNGDDIDHYNDIDMSSSTTSNQTNRSFVNSVKSYLKRNRSRNKLGDQSCNFLNSTNINQLSQIQQQQPLHASNKRPKFY